MPQEVRLGYALTVAFAVSLLGVACGGSSVSPSQPASEDAGLGAMKDANTDARFFDATASGPDATASRPEAGAACGAANCRGCCQQDLCYTGIDSDACGTGGQACQSCGANGLACVGQQCVKPCGAGTFDGCCAANQCLAGNVQTACGQHGGPCADCTVLAAECVSDAGTGGACKAAPTCNATYPSANRVPEIGRRIAYDVTDARIDGMARRGEGAHLRVRGRWSFSPTRAALSGSAAAQ
jgi:hypothetical protein